MIKIKRAYEPFEKPDGYRILVDRLWPRGIKKENAHIDVWIKEVAPSTDLRKWFDHDPDKWEDFKKKYKAELADKQDILKEIRSLEREHKKILLLYSSKEERLNNAIVLKEVLGGTK